MMVTCRTRFEEKIADAITKAAAAGKLDDSDHPTGSAGKTLTVGRKAKGLAESKHARGAAADLVEDDEDWAKDGKRSKGKSGNKSRRSKAPVGVEQTSSDDRRNNKSKGGEFVAM